MEDDDGDIIVVDNQTGNQKTGLDPLSSSLGPTLAVRGSRRVVIVGQGGDVRRGGCNAEVVGVGGDASRLVVLDACMDSPI
jgi:hypothetical protein